MPFESVYLSLDDQVIVEEGGTWISVPGHPVPEMGKRPVRAGSRQAGFPAIQQAQFLNRILDTLGEVAAFPAFWNWPARSGRWT
ncbi:MAG: hypothetical protein ACLSCR_02715 [Akkermansia sp.]